MLSRVAILTVLVVSLSGCAGLPSETVDRTAYVTVEKLQTDPPTATLAIETNESGQFLAVSGNTTVSGVDGASLSRGVDGLPVLNASSERVADVSALQDALRRVRTTDTESTVVETSPESHEKLVDAFTDIGVVHANGSFYLLTTYVEQSSG